MECTTKRRKVNPSPNLPKSVDGVYHEEEEGEPQPKHGNCPEVGVFWEKKISTIKCARKNLRDLACLSGKIGVHCKYLHV